MQTNHTESQQTQFPDATGLKTEEKNYMLSTRYAYDCCRMPYGRFFLPSVRPATVAVYFIYARIVSFSRRFLFFSNILSPWQMQRRRTNFDVVCFRYDKIMCPCVFLSPSIVLIHIAHPSYRIIDYDHPMSKIWNRVLFQFFYIIVNIYYHSTYIYILVFHYIVMKKWKKFLWQYILLKAIHIWHVEETELHFLSARKTYKLGKYSLFSCAYK